MRRNPNMDADARRVKIHLPINVRGCKPASKARDSRVHALLKRHSHALRDMVHTLYCWTLLILLADGFALVPIAQRLGTVWPLNC